jgi:hypothetical protein
MFAYAELYHSLLSQPQIKVANDTLKANMKNPLNTNFCRPPKARRPVRTRRISQLLNRSRIRHASPNVLMSFRQSGITHDIANPSKSHIIPKIKATGTNQLPSLVASEIITATAITRPHAFARYE